MQNEYKYNPIHAKNKYENIVCQMAVIWTRPSVNSSDAGRKNSGLFGQHHA